MENRRLQQLLSFLAQDPQDSFVLYSIAFELLQMEQLAEAQTYFERLLHHHPAYLGAYYQYGKCLRLLGQDAAAIEIYRQGMARASAAKEQHTFAELQNALMNTELGEEP